ncbi:MAG TPA: lipocalin family protein [Phycisphaerae bacterium]|nr:lipocalin family protein [Phycisphaerae bacterium]HRY70461.1 lipocalin family protein [Phycisphaerae bacterium]HSA27695.1 lipocalin family protein [Phycisphaerae bacterium]
MRSLPTAMSCLAWLLCLPWLAPLTGCRKTDPNDRKITTQVVGTWSRPLPLGAGEGREEVIEFKANGTCVSRIGEKTQTGKWRIEGGKIVLGKNPPLSIRRLSEEEFSFGNGEVPTHLTRKRASPHPPGGEKG